MHYILTRQVFHRGETQTITNEVTSTTLRIGRGTSNELRLDDLSVSLAHAILEYNHGIFVLRDLTGVGATYVGQNPIRQATVVDGDVIRIGPYRLHLSIPLTNGPATITVEEFNDSKAQDTVSLLPKYQLANGRCNKTFLSLTLLLVVLGLTAGAFALEQYRLFTPGKVSSKHSQFADQCTKCHSPWKAVWSFVPDKTCETCHAGPSHFGKQSLKPAPECAKCHVEHKEKPSLAFVPDADCIHCHADLKSKETRFPVHANIHSFTTDHPEFAVSVSASGQHPLRRVRLNETVDLKDTATLLLNHKVHLNPELQGPDGPEPLRCSNCHHLDEQGTYMKPITYEKDCQRCHLLDFDDRLPNVTVSHRKQPAELRAELQGAYYALRTRELGRPAFSRRLPGSSISREELYIEEMTAKAEKLLLSKRSKKCLLCHVLGMPSGGGGAASAEVAASSTPAVVIQKTLVPNRWLPYSKFDHGPHLGLPDVKKKGCVTCHESASSSQATTDVLLPRIKTCQACHVEPSGAQATCTTCHSYHDKTYPRPYDERQSPDSSSPIYPTATSTSLEERTE